MRMETFVPGIYWQWEKGRNISISVNDSHDFSGTYLPLLLISRFSEIGASFFFSFSGMEKQLLKPVVIASQQQLIMGAQNWSNHMNSVANSTETNEKIVALKYSLLELANFVYDQKDMKIYLYGSRFTGLAREDADVDIFLDMSESKKV